MAWRSYLGSFLRVFGWSAKLAPPIDPGVGTISVNPACSGSISVRPAVVGSVTVRRAVAGDVNVRPAVLGSISVESVE